jgi:hypothetical protein
VATPKLTDVSQGGKTVLHVETDRSHVFRYPRDQFLVITARFEKVRTDGHDGWWTYEEKDAQYLEHLSLRAQTDRDHVLAGSRDYYSRILAYRVNDVEYELAERMFKTLSKIRKAMYAKEEEDGPAQSLGQYLLRLCRIVGVSTMAFDHEPGAPNWGDTLYRECDLRHGSWLVDTLLADYVEEVQGKVNGVPQLNAST